MSAPEPEKVSPTPAAQKPVAAPTMEQTAQRIEERLASIDKSLMKTSGRDEDPRTERESSRAVVTATLAAGLWKIGALFGAKLGLFWGALYPEQVLKNNASVEALRLTRRKQNGEKNNSYSMFDDPMAKGAALIAVPLSTLGLLAGLVLGLTRGDRIERPGDLWHKPLESLGKILGSKPPAKKKEPAAQQAEKPGASEVQPVATQEATTQSADWQRKMDAQKAESISPASPTLH